jgi:hypothetical protein
MRLLLIATCALFAASVCLGRTNDRTPAPTLPDDLARLIGTWTIVPGSKPVRGEIRFEAVAEPGRAVFHRVRAELWAPWDSKGRLDATFYLREAGTTRYVSLLEGRFTHISGPLSYRFDGDRLVLTIADGLSNFIGEHAFERAPKK